MCVRACAWVRERKRERSTIPVSSCLLLAYPNTQELVLEEKSCKETETKTKKKNKRMKIKKSRTVISKINELSNLERMGEKKTLN